MAATARGAIALIGIDIGKNSFHVVGLDGRGAISSRASRWSVLAHGRAFENEPNFRLLGR